MTIKVLIIDDSILVRRVLEDIIDQNDDMEVIGSASDPYEAREIIKKSRPDVITLDVEMPKMDGLTFLDKVMRAIPTPVVMISSLTQENGSVTLKALELGAVDYIPKPSKGVFSSIQDLSDEVADKIRAAAAVPKSVLERHRTRVKMSSSGTMALDSKELSVIKNSARFTRLFPVIAIGASTGGTVAIEQFLKQLNHHVVPPIVIVQHIPPLFSRSLAERLNSILPFSVYEAENGRDLKKGDVVIAPGGLHLMLERTIAGYRAIVKDGPKVNRHKPSVDVLFRSVASAAGESAIGLMMTGMGADGAKGMKEMKDKKSLNIVQSKDSCTVYGMPKAAYEIGAADISLSIEGMASYINRIFEGNF